MGDPEPTPNSPRLTRTAFRTTRSLAQPRATNPSTPDLSNTQSPITRSDDRSATNPVGGSSDTDGASEKPQATEMIPAGFETRTVETDSPLRILETSLATIVDASSRPARQTTSPIDLTTLPVDSFSQIGLSSSSMATSSTAAPTQLAESISLDFTVIPNGDASRLLTSLGLTSLPEGISVNLGSQTQTQTASDGRVFTIAPAPTSGNGDDGSSAAAKGKTAAKYIGAVLAFFLLCGLIAWFMVTKRRHRRDRARGVFFRGVLN
jgi:hypothetical protein